MTTKRLMTIGFSLAVMMTTACSGEVIPTGPAITESFDQPAVEPPRADQPTMMASDSVVDRIN